MISLVDQPYIVTLKDGTAAGDDTDILMLGFDRTHAAILAAREILWVPLDSLLVETALASYQLVEDDDAPEE